MLDVKENHTSDMTVKL